MSSSDVSQQQTTSVSTPSPIKRCRNSETISSDINEAVFSPSNTQIVRVLCNDPRNKMICLHTKFADAPDVDSITILEKSPFPNEVSELCSAKVGSAYTENDAVGVVKNQVNFPEWKVSDLLKNDIYHRFSVLAGLEDANKIFTTVIRPAGPQHFAKYSSSKRQIVSETPEIYKNVILPFLESNPKDLAWVDNIFNGTAEVERVLFKSDDTKFGFTLVLDYRWDGKHLNELHALALVRDPELKCLRDLRANHLSMLKEMLTAGRKKLVEKYGDLEEQDSLREDQIIAYFHYPPTFYRLHMHFIHVGGSTDGGTQVGKAILAEDVIANIELKSDYYAERTIPIYLHDTHPFLAAIRKSELE